MFRSPVVVLVVLDPVLWNDSDLVLEQPELEGLESRGGGEEAAEVHEVEGGHRLQDGDLLHADLKRT